MQAQQHKAYSAADIERYYNGGMTAAEMHSLEKAALEDAFLADALEGYVHTKTPAADVAQLKEKLQRRSQNVVPLRHNRRLMLSIAALLILLIGFGWLTYQFSTNKLTEMALRNEQQPASNQPASTADSVNKQPDESITFLNKPVNHSDSQTSSESAIKKKETEPENTLAKKTQPSLANKDVNEPQTFSEPHMAAPTARTLQSKASEAIPESTSVAKQSLLNTFQGRVVDENSLPVPFATVAKLSSKTATMADAEGKFSLTLPDSTIAVSVQAAGYKGQVDTLTPQDKDVTIVIRRGETSLQEVIVTGIGKENAPGRVHVEAAKPLVGWNRFYKYSHQRIVDVKQTDSLTERGEVVLTFDVDDEGNAVNIAIEKSLGAAYDSTAEHLIQQGSRWKKIKSGKARARIQF